MPNHTDELPAVFQLRIGPDRDMRNRVNGPIMPEASVVGALDAIPAAPQGLAERRRKHRRRSARAWVVGIRSRGAGGGVCKRPTDALIGYWRPTG